MELGSEQLSLPLDFPAVEIPQASKHGKKKPAPKPKPKKLAPVRVGQDGWPTKPEDFVSGVCGYCRPGEWWCHCGESPCVGRLPSRRL